MVGYTRMAVDLLNRSNLEQLALKGLINLKQFADTILQKRWQNLKISHMLILDQYALRRVLIATFWEA